MTWMRVLAGICLAYYIVIVCYAGISADFAWIWPVGAGVILGLDLLIRSILRKGGSLMHPLLIGIGLLILAGCLLAGWIGYHILGEMLHRNERDAEYCIVLGAQVRGTKPSRALRKRLDAAAEYAKEHPDTILILSGGQGSGEEISEAECMKQYLMEHGIPQTRMILEAASTTTRENLIFSARLCPCKERTTGILTNNFHVYRALLQAGKIGYRDPIGIPAPSDPVMQIHYIVREIFAVVKEMMVQ